MSEESFVYTACPGWGDHDYCAIKTIVKDGKIVRTERVVYSDPEEPDGHICQKGCLAGLQPYNPNRLKKPLKRVGERGEGKWEEITWDQALDEIAEKMDELANKYGRESIAYWSLTAGVPPSFGMSAMMCSRFSSVWGGTNPMASIGLDNGPFYTEFYQSDTAFFHILGDPRNIIGTDIVYVWGSNPVENQMRGAQNLVRAREAGAKIVDIGLIFDGTAGFADEFYGVKPGSDAYLSMYMMNYAFINDKIDYDYLANSTIAGYMVRDDDGTLARDDDGNYIVYDKSADAFATVAPGGGALPSGELDLFACGDCNGVAVKSVLQLLKERASEYTAELAAEKTGLEIFQVEHIAEQWVCAKNAFIMAGYGMRYGNSNETYRSLVVLGMLTGRMGKPKNGVMEGLQLQGYPMATNDAAVTMPDGMAAVKSVSVRMPEWFKIAQAPNSPYKAMIVANGNPVHQQPDRKRWLDVINQMELVVDIDIWMTDTGELADYVLPDCMPFEREDLIAPSVYNHVVLQQPAIEPPEGCDPHDAVYFWSELGKRLGVGEYFKYTVGDYINMRLDVDYPPISSVKPKITYERLCKEPLIRMNVPDEPKFDPYMGDIPLSTPTGRHEIYVERLKDFDLQFPKPLPMRIYGTNPDYPYQLFTGRQRFFMQSSFTDDPITVKMSGETPSTRINPKDARELDLHAGDKVEVYNDRGHVVTRLEIDESVPAGTIHVWFGWRARQFEEGTYSEMVAQCSGEVSASEVEDKWFADWVAAGNTDNAALNAIVVEIGSTDMYWDSHCNIRRYDAAKEA